MIESMLFEDITINIGDYIEFRATTRDTNKKAKRKVVGFLAGYVLVRYQGYSEFMVYKHEIIRVIKA